jgi:hypothetical protein
MPARLLSHVLFIVRLLPTWAVRRLTRSSRFDTRFHHADTSWDV